MNPRPCRLFDLAVIGGGPAGVSAVCAARRLGARTTLLDVARRERPLELVPALALSILRTMDIDPRALFAGCPRVNRFISAWKDGVLRQRSTITSPHGEDIVIDRCLFAKRLRDVAENAGAFWHEGRVAHVQRTRDRGFVLVNTDGSTTQCRKLIVATGRHPFSALKGNSLRFIDRRVAIYPHRPGGIYRDGVSAEFVVESCAAGWWYGIRDNSETVHPVLVTDAEQLPARAEWGSWFTSRLQATSLLSMHSGAERYASEELRICSACSSSRLTPGGENWSLAGDARLAISPLSGNGIIRAVQDGVRAVNFALGKHHLRGCRDFAREHARDLQITLRRQSEASS